MAITLGQLSDDRRLSLTSCFIELLGVPELLHCTVQVSQSLLKPHYPIRNLDQSKLSAAFLGSLWLEAIEQRRLTDSSVLHQNVSKTRDWRVENL